MKTGVATLMGGVVVAVFLLALMWEFVVEEPVVQAMGGQHEESVAEKWEYIVTATCFSAIALIIPGLLLARSQNRLVNINRELEQRVEQQVRERIGIKLALGNESAGRRQAEWLNARLGRIIENSLNEVYIFDAKTLRFTQVNRCGRDNLGRSMDQLATMRCFDLLPRFARKKFEQELDVLRAGGVDQAVFETLHERKDGSRYDVEVRIQYLPREEPPLFVAFVQDITERKNAERELVEARERAEVASREKSRFLAQMSHEMRTPLNGILGSTELLLAGVPDSKQRELARITHQSGELLLDMINALLDQSKIEVGRLRMESVVFDLRHAVGDVANLVSGAVQTKGLVLTTEIADEVPERVSGDLRHYRQVLINLVSNAVKFTDAGEVAVRCTSTGGAPEGLLVRTEVTDTGIGVAPQLLERIFEPFTQVDDSTTRRHEGVGLGLAIARELVESMGGEIAVESVPGRGSSFSFTVPLKTPPDAVAVATAAMEGSVETVPRNQFRGRVLIAEDNPVSAYALQEMLNYLGCDAISARNGTEAVETCARESFDLVLMDCWMPEMDGFEATERIRAHELEAQHPSPTPVIACTAHVTEAEHKRCIASGMNHCLSKPITLAQLSNLLRHWLVDENRAAYGDFGAPDHAQTRDG